MKHRIANGASGFELLAAQLMEIGCPPSAILIGLEATGRYWENVYQFLLQHGYRLVLLHPGQTHHFAERRGLRAKTDKLDAVTIARAVLSDDMRPAYVPSELIVAYRELMRLHANLTDEAARYKNEVRDLVVVLFPEFTQVFKDLTGPTALALLHAYPSAQAITAAGVDTIRSFLHDVAAPKYGRHTAAKLVALATRSSASPVAVAARGLSLAILTNQLLHTQTNRAELDREIESLLERDDAAARLHSVPEFGTMTVAVLRAEYGTIRPGSGAAP